MQASISPVHDSLLPLPIDSISLAWKWWGNPKDVKFGCEIWTRITDLCLTARVFMASDPKYCTLVSSDGFSFTVTREAACVSGTLKGMLNSGFSEATSGLVRLESIEGILLERVCDYLYYFLKYKDQKDVPRFNVEPELALNLLVASDFLDGETCQRPRKGADLSSVMARRQGEII